MVELKYENLEVKYLWSLDNRIVNRMASIGISCTIHILLDYLNVYLYYKWAVIVILIGAIDIWLIDNVGSYQWTQYKLYTL